MEGVRTQVQKMHHDMENTNRPKIDLNGYKRHFMNIANKETAGRFKVDDTNRKLVSDLFNYFMCQPGNLDLNKGLWLEGSIGTGKTTLMHVFSKFMISLQNGFKIYSCTSVANCYTIDGNLDFFLHNREGFLREPVDVCFDELGREPMPSSHYGTKLNVMQHVLHVRYQFWKETGLKTYVITNFDAVKIGELYGDFIRDRRKEMFNIIPVVGESRR